MMVENKSYLGDGVYAEFDGYSIVLFTHDGYARMNEIVLEPTVFEVLQMFIERFIPRSEEKRE